MPWDYNRKTKGGADFIAERTQFLQRIGILPELLSGFKADRVDDKVGMDMGGIAMGADQHLMSRPGLCRKFQGNLVGLPVGDIFPGREGLHILIEVHAIRLAVGTLGRHKFRDGVFSEAVHAGNILPPSLSVQGFAVLHTVSHDTDHGADCLLPFGNIGDDRHYFLPPMRASCS